SSAHSATIPDSRPYLPTEPTPRRAAGPVSPALEPCICVPLLLLATHRTTGSRPGNCVSDHPAQPWGKLTTRPVGPGIVTPRERRQVEFDHVKRFVTSGPTVRRIQSVDRALQLLEVLRLGAQPIGLKTLSEQTGINPATAHLLLRTLAARNYVHHDAVRKDY